MSVQGEGGLNGADADVESARKRRGILKPEVDGKVKGKRVKRCSETDGQAAAPPREERGASKGAVRSARELLERWTVDALDEARGQLLMVNGRLPDENDLGPERLSEWYRTELERLVVCGEEDVQRSDETVPSFMEWATQNVLKGGSETPLTIAREGEMTRANDGPSEEIPRGEKKRALPGAMKGSPERSNGETLKGADHEVLQGPVDRAGATANRRTGRASSEGEKQVSVPQTVARLEERSLTRENRGCLKTAFEEVKHEISGENSISEGAHGEGERKSFVNSARKEAAQGAGEEVLKGDAELGFKYSLEDASRDALNRAFECFAEGSGEEFWPEESEGLSQQIAKDSTNGTFNRWNRKRGRRSVRCENR
jgi:hypothetical protein